MEESKDGFLFTDEMIEGLVEDENNYFIETVVDTVRESNDRYRIVIENIMLFGEKKSIRRLMRNVVRC